MRKYCKYVAICLCCIIVVSVAAWFANVQILQKAADQGLAEAQLALGLLHGGGQGVLKDEAKAMHWYQKAADQGLARAQVILGTMYFIGQGVPQDYNKAAHWYQKAADQGYAEGQFRLGMVYLLGMGVIRDQQRGCELMHASLVQGEKKVIELYNERYNELYTHWCVGERAKLVKNAEELGTIK